MKLKTIIILTSACALLVTTVGAQTKLKKSAVKGDDTDDLEDEDDESDTGSDIDTSPLLLHELNTGPSIEIHPLEMEVPQRPSAKLNAGDPEESYYVTCAVDNALAVRMICLTTDPSLVSSSNKDTVRSKDKSRSVKHDAVDHSAEDKEQPITGGTKNDAMNILVMNTSATVDIVNPMTGVRHNEIKASMTPNLLQHFRLSAKKASVALYCICDAWNSKARNRSKVATIKFTPASEEKSDKIQRRVVPLGEKVLLECPLGSSASGYDHRTVFWLWNDAEIMLNDNVEVDTKKGSLLILRAGPANEGSYTCGVRGSSAGAGGKDHVSARLGETVVIDIRTDGSWSSWGAWSECTARCGRGYRTRTRSCTNPPARNGGRECPGDYMLRSDCHTRKMCTSSDKDNGDTHSLMPQWSAWTDWSVCGPDCKQHRQRWCRGSNRLHQQQQQQQQHPEQYQDSGGNDAGGSSGGHHLSGGSYPQQRQTAPNAYICPGLDHMSTNCTGGKCPLDFNTFPPLIPQHGVDNLLNNNNNYLQDQQSSSTHEQGFIIANFGSVQAVVLVIGMALSAIILAFTFLIALRFWPRDSAGSGDKRQPPLPLHMAYTTVPGSGLSTLPSDVTASLDRDPRLHDFITNRRLDSGVTVPLLQQVYTAPNNCAIPMTPSQARANFFNLSRTPSSTGKTHRSDSESQQSGHPCSDYGAPGSSCEYDFIYDTIPGELTESANSTGAGSANREQSPGGSLPRAKSSRGRQIAWLTVGAEGGRVALESLGVCVTVPPDAIRHGRREIYVAVLDDAEHELSAKLRKGQCILSPVVQCGPADVELARPVVLSIEQCAHPSGDKWNMHLLSADEGTNAHEQSIWRMRLSLDSPEEHSDILCHRDGRTCHIQTGQLGRFALCGESKIGSYAAKSIVLLSFLTKRRSLSQAERVLKVYCVEDTKAATEVVFRSGQDDCTLVESPRSILLHDGGANLCFALEELSLPQGWSVKSSSLQEIPFSRIWSSSSGAHCSFSLLSSVSSSFSDRELPLECQVTVYQRGNQSHRQTLNINSSTASPAYRNLGLKSVDSVAVNGTRGSPVTQHPVEALRLTTEARNRLCSMLDAPTRDGPGDWAKLAVRLGLQRNMGYFASKASPTACLLDLWEVHHREDYSAPSNLLTLLKQIGRADAVTAVEKLLGAWV